MKNDFSFTVICRDSKTNARTGIIRTPHGDIQTPAFVPVGTQATVKSLTPDELRDLDVHLFFVNTYHAFLRPGLDVIEKAGGLHQFMHWEQPIITDSGGFQVFSLGSKRFARKNDVGKGEASLVRITDDGVTFKSHWDGEEHIFTPENSMRYQWALGSDIHIAFDDCTPYAVTHAQAEKSMYRTHAWAARSVAAHRILQKESAANGSYQALYGSIQGSVFEDLRKISAQTICDMDFDGLAIGGVSVGETKAEMVNVLRWVTPFLPKEKPRHLLGVGEVDDIFALVEYGMDTFDCVQPTRLARMGHLYHSNHSSKNTDKSFMFDINSKEFEGDMTPIDAKCPCYTCRNFSRAYIHHLFRVRELLAYRLASIHNIHFINALVSEVRLAISNGSFLDLKNKWLYNR